MMTEHQADMIRRAAHDYAATVADRREAETRWRLGPDNAPRDAILRTANLERAAAYELDRVLGVFTKG